MWLEIGVGVLLALALVQCALLYRLWQHSLQLQRRVEQVVHDSTHGVTAMPSSNHRRRASPTNWPSNWPAKAPTSTSW